MGDFVRLLIDALAYVWPFRLVHTWERAGYLVFGKWRKEIGPGIYPVVPWFCDVHSVSIAESPCGTDRLDVTLSDGTLASFQAVAMARVVDVRKAVCDVEHFATSTEQILAAVTADRLGEIDAKRLEPDKRGRLLTSLTGWVNKETEVFGVAVREVRFTSIVLNLRAHRLLVDQSHPATW